PQEAAAHRERVRERFPEREEGELETVDEQHEPRDDEERALDQREEARDRLSEDDAMKEQDDEDDGRHVADRAENHAPKQPHTPSVRIKRPRASLTGRGVSRA